MLARTVPHMEALSAVQTGRYLGISERTVRNWVNRSELEPLSTDPLRFDPQHVHDVLHARQADALADLARTRQTPVTLAAEVRRTLLRPNASVLPDRRAEDQQRRLALVPDTAKRLFGVASLSAVLAEDGCQWCAAQKFAKFLGTWAPTEFSPAFRMLFGGQAPCAECAPGLYAPLMAALREQVHPGAPGPSTPQQDPPPAPVTAGPPPAPTAPPTAAHRPAQAASRPTTPTRPPRKATAAKVGRRWCGHLLAAGCSCPTRQTRPTTRPVEPPDTCGCVCQHSRKLAQ